MSNDKGQGGDPQELDVSFAVELDEDLLAAALTAVESHRRDRGGQAPPARADLPGEGPAPSKIAEIAEIAEIELELDLESPGEAPGPAAEPAPAEAAESQGLRQQAESQGLRQQVESQGLRQQLEEQEQDRRRLRGALRRVEEQLARDSGKLERERASRRGAEDRLNLALRRIEQLEAEQQAIRDRRRKEREDERHGGTRTAVDAVLPALDHLELAISHKHEDPTRVVTGIAMVVQQFHQALAQLGVARVVAEPGVLFDPEIHEALTEVRTDELLPGSVVAELRPGYALQGRLLRAARVSVAISTVPAADLEPNPPAPSTPQEGESDVSEPDSGESPDPPAPSD